MHSKSPEAVPQVSAEGHQWKDAAGTESLHKYVSIPLEEAFQKPLMAARDLNRAV